MCDESMLVPIPDLLWEAGAIYQFDPTHPEYGIDGQGRRCLKLDACIVPAIGTLWAAGIVTMSCCCGHGDPWGVITIQTETAKGRKGAMVIRVEEYDTLRADLAASEARAERAEYRLARIEEANAIGDVDFQRAAEAGAVLSNWAWDQGTREEEGGDAERARGWGKLNTRMHWWWTRACLLLIAAKRADASGPDAGGERR